MHVLISSMPATGHVNPLRPVAAELVRRGHTVTWLTGAAFRAQVEQTGATFAPMQATPDFDAIPVTPDPGSSGLGAGVSVMRRLFIDRMAGQMEDYSAILQKASALPVDLLLADMCSLGAHALRDRGDGPVYATLGINPLVTFDPEIPPWGSGGQPPATWFGQLLNRISHAIGLWLFMPRVTALVEAERAKLGLSPLPQGMGFHNILRSPYLHLMPTTPAFEFPRAALESQIRFVGPLLPPAKPKDATELPSWFDDLNDKTVVHVTQGTYATDAVNLIRPTIEALKDENVLLVVTSPDASASIDTTQLPTNVRIADFVPHSLLLPLVDVMVTNAGYNGVLAALAQGVPLVCAGRSEDKADVSARVAWCGAGIDLGTDKPTPAAIRQAILQILKDSKCKAAAQKVREDFAKHNSPAEACYLLEELAKDSAVFQKKQDEVSL